MTFGAISAEVCCSGLRGCSGVKMVSERPGLSTGLHIYPAKARVTDGARTRDLRDHNPMLCQLSYGHHATFRFYQQALALQNARPRQEEPKASASRLTSALPCQLRSYPAVKL